MILVRLSANPNQSIAAFLLIFGADMITVKMKILLFSDHIGLPIDVDY
jgi:hypothetical protein